MKKIYITLLAGLFTCQIANAQLSLTKVFNEPSLGDVNNKLGFDSTSAIPKSTGANQNWNFTSLTSNSLTSSATYTTVASTPSASTFNQATLAEHDGAGNYNYWKSTATAFELAGSIDNTGGFVNVQANTGVVATWPINFGYNATDNFSGTVNFSSLPGTLTGTMTMVGSGNGTITLPGNLMLGNILQTRLTQTVVVNLGFITATLTINEYSYYHGTQKFPLLVVSYSTTDTGGGPTLSYEILGNSAVLTGINEGTLQLPEFVLFPNPATNRLNIMLENSKGENVNVEIMNGVGQTVKTVNIGTASSIYENIDLSSLSSGVYFVKTSIGEKVATKKLVIQ
jgi:hypothetical protein